MAFGNSVDAGFVLFEKKGEVIDLGRKESLTMINHDLLDIATDLRHIRSLDVKARKSRGLARLKPKYTADIDRIDLLLDVIVSARKLVRGMPKAVQ